MKTEAITTFEVLPEREERFTVTPETIKKALDDGQITIDKMIKISQIWFAKNADYSARIRETRALEAGGKNFWEHTVKHHMEKKLDYEVTTDLKEFDYGLLVKRYKKKGIETKVRFYVTDTSGDYEDYIITVDYPQDKPKECWVEFELKDKGGDIRGFTKPDWLNE